MQDQLIDILAVVSGIVIIILSTGVAIRTFMVPAGAPPLINRVLFRFTQALFDAAIRPIRSGFASGRPLRAARHYRLRLYARPLWRRHQADAARLPLQRLRALDDGL